MSASDELVHVIAEALADEFCTHIAPWNEERDGCSECLARADAVLAALVERYGEPEIEHDPLMVHPMDLRPKNYLRRLMFPWRQVTDG